MINGNLTTQVTARLAALDFTAENSSIQNLEAEIANARRATDRANERISEIGEVLVAGRQPAHAVADALLANADPSEAAEESPSAESLESEREMLRQGVSELQERIRNLESQIASVRAQAKRRLAEAAQPLVDALIAEARTAAGCVVDCYAALRAVQTATGAGSREAAAAQDAFDGFSPAHGGLLPARRELEVPVEISSVLESITGKGPAIRATVLTTITVR